MIAAALVLAIAVEGAAQPPPAGTPAIEIAGPPTKGVAPAVNARPSDNGLPVHPYRLQVGDRVRFWPLSESALHAEGTVLASDGTSLTVVRPRGEAELLPLRSVARMDVRRGNRHIVRGALVGALGGAALYALFESDLDKGHDWQTQVGHGAIAAASGALVGGIAGGTLYRPRWVPVDLAAAPGVTQAPTAPALRLTLRF